MLVLGGIGTLIGGMIGAVVFTVTRDELAAIDPVYWSFWMGLILCAIVLSGSGGISGGLRRLEARVRSRAGPLR
jgi:branched-chain amino acid transport system permease protein